MNKKSINKKKGGSSSNFSKLSNELKRKIIKKYSNSNTENALASRLFSLTSRNGYKRVVENKEGNKSIKNKEYNRIITKPAQIFMNKFNNFSEKLDLQNNLGENNGGENQINYPIYSKNKQVILKTLEKWGNSNHYINDVSNGHSPLDHIPNELLCDVKNIKFILKITKLVPSEILIETINNRCESLEEGKKTIFDNDEFIQAIMKHPNSSDIEFIKEYISLGLFKIFYHISNELKNDTNIINDIKNTVIDQCILHLKEKSMDYQEIPEYIINEPRFIETFEKLSQN